MKILEKLRAAPDGRNRRDGVPARQDEEHQVQRRVLRFDEALIAARLSIKQKPRLCGVFVFGQCPEPAWHPARRLGRSAALQWGQQARPAVVDQVDAAVDHSVR